MKHIPYHKPVVYDSFYEMLKGLYDNNSDTVAIQYMKGTELIQHTYRELIEHISSLFGFYIKDSIINQHIGIIAENRFEYVTVYLASVFSNVIAPIDKEITPQLLEQMLEKFEIKVLFCTNKTARIINNTKLPDDIRIINIDKEYESLISNTYKVENFFDEIKSVDRHRFSVLAFTSGTTGDIKGVMLSQYNIVSNLRAGLENNKLHKETLLVLPMNHTYAFNPGVLTAMYNAATLSLNMDLKHFARDMKMFNPWYIGVVPMIVEGIYNNIIREARRTNKEKLLNNMIKVSNFFRKLGIDLRHLFFGKLINKGLRVIVSGGAALNPYYVEKFDELGIAVLNGYGLTECSPLISVNREVNNISGSVGTIIKDDEVKIAEDGEIMVKGPNVMLGYYKDEEATKLSLREGYFYTGDLGYVEENVLFITGRKKNLIILGNGKNFSPELVENKLLELDYIKECIVTTQNEKVVALIYPEGDIGALDSDIKKINKNLPSYMNIDDYEIMKEEFEKNSNKKIVRNKYVG